MSFNKVILIGNVGRDPEIRRFENSIKASFSLATSETYTPRGGEKVTQTEWHNIVAWRRLAEISESYIHKGSQILVEGKIRYRSYDDKEGNKKYVVEIEADNIQLLGRKADGQSAPGQTVERSASNNNNGAGNNSFQAPANNGAGNNSFQAPADTGNGFNDFPGEDFTSRESGDDLPF